MSNENTQSDPKVRPIIEAFLKEIESLPYEEQNRAIEGIVQEIKYKRAKDAETLSQELKSIEIACVSLEQNLGNES